VLFRRLKLAFTLQICTWMAQIFSADYRTVAESSSAKPARVKCYPLRQLSKLASESLTIDRPADFPSLLISQFFR
jgi:hypothetical protein